MYRVDRRIFQVNEIIPAPEVPYQDQDGFDNAIENVLHENRPQNNQANRRQTLFIFQELSDAIRFSCKMTNSKIYKVRPNNDTLVFHRGDMNWTEVMNRMRDNAHSMETIAGFYWNGESTFKPCWEILVNSVAVDAVLVSNEQQRSQICTAYRMQADLNIERLPFFIQNLNI